MRQVIRALAALTIAGIAGCATGTSPTALSLAQVQAETTQINAAIQASNAIYQASTASAADKASAALAAADAGKAETVVAGLSAANTTTLQGFVLAAEKILPLLAPVLSLNPATAAAMTLALALVQAFDGSVALPVTIASGGTVKVGAALVLVPVPLPR